MKIVFILITFSGYSKYQMFIVEFNKVSMEHIRI
jgi:hypothetical protein